MNKFKIGDKVRCINPGGTNKFTIQKGEVYTVANRDAKLIGLAEFGSPYECLWFDDRFELVKSFSKEEKKDKKVKRWGF